MDLLQKCCGQGLVSPLKNSGLSPIDIADIDLYKSKRGIIAGKDFKIHEFN